MRQGPHDEQRQRWTEGLTRELGETIVGALGNDDLVEVLLNPDGRLWLDSRTEGMYDSGSRLLPQEAEAILASIAGMLGTQIDSEHPIIEAELPLDGSRIEGMVPPLVASPCFAIRKRATRVFPLSHYIETGSMTLLQAELLRAAIAERRNILISGGTGSGKTTLVNAILDEMVRLGEPSERFILLEDTVELQCTAENHTALRTTRHVDLATLVKATMRLNPDRIIIGEVRGREALDLLKAWNTGHPGGCTTVHANNAVAALHRLDQLAQEAGVPSQRALIADTVGLVVHIEGGSRGRRVSELVRVAGLAGDGSFQLEPTAARLTEEE